MHVWSQGCKNDDLIFCRAGNNPFCYRFFCVNFFLFHNFTVFKVRTRLFYNYAFPFPIPGKG